MRLAECINLLSQAPTHCAIISTKCSANRSSYLCGKLDIMLCLYYPFGKNLHGKSWQPANKRLSRKVSRLSCRKASHRIACWSGCRNQLGSSSVRSSFYGIELRSFQLTRSNILRLICKGLFPPQPQQISVNLGFRMVPFALIIYSGPNLLPGPPNGNRRGRPDLRQAPNTAPVVSGCVSRGFSASAQIAPAP